MAFALPIRQRYQGKAGRWARLGLVFRQPGAGVIAVHAYHRHHVQVAPRFSLTMRTAPTPTGAQPHRLLETRVVQQPGAGFIQEHWRVEKLVQRLVARELRIDSMVTTGTAARPGETVAPPLVESAYEVRPQAEPAARPIQRIVRRATVEAIPYTQAAGSDLPAPVRSQAQPPPGWTAVSAAPAPTLSGAEVKRVADQVLQVIDRRVTAHRERMGRN
jgi:hypothetical protein